MINETVIPAALGVLLCVLGIFNMTGNVSSLHLYHRKRVTEEDRKPFGRLVGLGTLLIGVALIVFGVLFFMYQKTQNELYSLIGTATLIAGVVIGIVLNFYAMIKYNKGIF